MAKKKRFKWLFVNGEINIQLLISEHNASKQFNIEIMMNPKKFLEAFNIKGIAQIPNQTEATQKTRQYIC